jgi:HSP20 family protein
MIRPDIKTFHNDWRQRWLNPDIHRRHFFGKGALDMYWHNQDTVDANLKKSDQHFELEIAMPGFTKEDIEVFLKDEILTVRGVKKKEDNPTPEYIIKEFNLDLVERKFQLVKGMELDKVEAHYSNEILNIVFFTNNKQQESPRVISVD